MTADMTAGSCNIMVVGLAMPKARCRVQTVPADMRCAARGAEHEVKPKDEEGPVRIRTTANFTASN